GPAHRGSKCVPEAVDDLHGHAILGYHHPDPRRATRSEPAPTLGRASLGGLRPMLFRVTSLKTRTALAIASVIGAILLANAVYLILAKREELKRDTETHAELFVKLTHGPIASLYEAQRDFGPG